MNDVVIEKKNIIVVGDLILDRYCIGSVDRISPEAPVPVFLQEDTRCVLGGAANVVANLISAGQEVYAFSVIGQDIYGDVLLDEMSAIGCDTSGILRAKDHKTIVKTRILAKNNQQLLRIDEEEVLNIDAELVETLLNLIRSKIEKADLIILSDYMKGILTLELCSGLIKEAKKHGIPVFVDVKDSNVEKYVNATLLKPNKKELALMTGKQLRNKEEILNAAMELLEKGRTKYVLVTLGSKGMLLVAQNFNKWIPAQEREVYDVSGAGDTVIAYMGAAVANGAEYEDAASFANFVAGIKVTKIGTAPVAIEEVREEIENVSKISGKLEKVVKLEKFKNRLSALREKKIVFTNGCFDIIHSGHIQFLRRAKSFGDLLVVGLNSDESVRRLKGESRPINCQRDRAAVLAALEFVDFVIIFDEDTPINLIHEIRPNVLVKGADYRKEEIVGASFVESYGGEVQIVEFLEGHSTTEMINRIRN